MPPIPGAPGAEQVWKVGGNTYLMYRDPIGRTPILYRVYKKDFDDVFGVDVEPDYYRTFKDHDERRARGRLGGVLVGNARRIKDTSDDPFRKLEEDFKREAKIRPWLREPEMAALYAQATLEGRSVTDAEIKGTKWWQTRTEGERAWVAKVNADPKTARQELVTNRLQVREMFRESGWGEVPLTLVDYYADQWTKGEISEGQLADRIEHELDPTAPGASPFAGRYLPPGAKVIGDKAGNQYVRIGNADYRLTGEGQIARYGTGAAGRKPDEIVGNLNIKGTIRDYFEDEGLPDENMALGGEEELRQRVGEKMGSHRAESYDQAWYRAWAGKIRRNPNEIERFEDELRRQFVALYPQYAENPDITYADVAQPWKAAVSRAKGTGVEDGDALLEDLIRENNAGWAQQRLNTQGLKEGWAPTVTKATTALQQAYGDQVRGMVG